MPCLCHPPFVSLKHLRGEPFQYNFLPAKGFAFLQRRVFRLGLNYSVCIYPIRKRSPKIDEQPSKRETCEEKRQNQDDRRLTHKRGVFF